MGDRSKPRSAATPAGKGLPPPPHMDVGTWMDRHKNLRGSGHSTSFDNKASLGRSGGQEKGKLSGEPALGSSCTSTPDFTGCQE